MRPFRPSIPLLTAYLTILLSACSGGKESTPDAGDSACDADRYATTEPGGMPGWTPEAGCEVLCEATDAEGRAYSGCFLSEDQFPICEYGEPCP